MNNGTRIILLLLVSIVCVPGFAGAADPAGDCIRAGQTLCGGDPPPSDRDLRDEDHLQTQFRDRDIQREMSRDPEMTENMENNGTYRHRERDTGMLEDLLLESTASETVPPDQAVIDD